MGMTVVLETGEKGPQIARVLEVGPAPIADRAPAAPMARAEAASDEAQGTVKFYNSDKGFGFIGLAFGGKDIFVHASTLARSAYHLSKRDRLLG
jgi:cold shock protein